jgi:hypothetical protein
MTMGDFCWERGEGTTMARTDGGTPPRQGARRFAFDPRLAIGLAVVAASVAGVVAVVAAADETESVYATRDSLAPGDRVRPGDLEEVRVRLDVVTDEYLAPGEIPAAGVVLTRPVGAGELLAASAVGRSDGVRSSPLVLAVAGELATSVRAGALVDIWAASEVENGDFGPPVVIVADARVVRLVESEGIMASGGATAVEVLVPKSKVARVLEAVADSDSMSIVPASIPLRG